MSNNKLNTIIKRMVNKMPLLLIKIVMGFNSEIINNFLKEMLEFDQKTMNNFLIMPELYVSLLSERGPNDPKKRKLAINSIASAKSKLYVEWKYRIAINWRLIDSSYEKYKYTIDSVDKIRSEEILNSIVSAIYSLCEDDVTYEKHKCIIDALINSKNYLYTKIIKEVVLNSHFNNISDEKYIYAINSISNAKNDEYAELISNALYNLDLINTSYEKFKYAIDSISNAKNKEYAKIIESILLDSNFINTSTDEEFNNILNLVSNVSLESTSIIMDLLTVIFGFNMKLSNFNTEKLLVVSSFYEFYLNKKKDDLKRELSDDELINFKNKFLAAIIEEPNIIDTLSDRIKIFKSNQGIELNSSEILKLLKENEQNFTDVSQKFSRYNKTTQLLYEEYLSSLSNNEDSSKVKHDATLKREHE